MHQRNRVHLIIISLLLLFLHQCRSLIPPPTTATPTSPKPGKSPNKHLSKMNYIQDKSDDDTVSTLATTKVYSPVTTNHPSSQHPNIFQKLKRRFSVYLLFGRLFLNYKLAQRRETKLKKHLLKLNPQYNKSSIDDHPSLVELWSSTNRKNASLLLTQIQRLEGFWIKVGQYLSSRADIMPEEYLTTLSVLQDRMPPKGFEEEVMVTLREELGGVTGGGVDGGGDGECPLDRFEWIDPVPLSTASLAQVHRATLKPPPPSSNNDPRKDDSGQPSSITHQQEPRDVVIKVQHRGISSLLLQDMANLRSILKILARLEGPEADYTPIFTEYSTEVKSELDFRLEADNMDAVRTLLARNEVRAIVPRAIGGLVTERVLVMEYCEGFAVRDVDMLEKNGVDRELLLRRIVESWAVQMHVGGIFNADPHPGNILVSTSTDGDASVPVLLDFGLTKRLSPGMKVAFARLMHASDENDLDALLTSFEEMGLVLNRKDPFEDMASMRRSFGSTTPQSEVKEAKKERTERFEKRKEAMEKEMEKEEEADGAMDTKQKQKRRNPVDAWPAELIFFGRVTNMLRGLCSRLEVRYPYLETMAVAARQTLLEEVPLEERAQDLMYSPPHRPSNTNDNADKPTTLQQRLIEAIHQLQKDNDMVGLQITVLSNSKPLANLAAGTLGTANPRPVTPSTLFCVFSVSKAVLTVALLRLLQQGIIRSVDDPIALYWPEFGGNGKKDITVRHILTHRAGMANAIPDGATVDMLCDFEGMVKFVEGAEAEHGAGEMVKYHYLTYAWIVGGLIERVTGKKYEEYLDEVLGRSMMEEICLGGVPEDFDGNRLAVLSLDRRPITASITSSVRKEESLRNESESESESEASKDVTQQIKSHTNAVEERPSGASPKDQGRKVLAKYRGREQMLNPSVFNMRKVRAARIPSANGHASAQGLATLFDSLVSGGDGAGPLESRIVELAREVQPPPAPVSGPSLSSDRQQPHQQQQHDDTKQAMLSDGASFGLGFQSHAVTLADGRIVRSIGHSGYGGSIVIAVPEANLSVAIVINKLSMKSQARTTLLKIVFDEFNISYPSSLEMS